MPSNERLRGMKVTLSMNFVLHVFQAIFFKMKNPMTTNTKHQGVVDILRGNGGDCSKAEKKIYRIVPDKRTMFILFPLQKFIISVRVAHSVLSVPNFCAIL